MIIRFHALAKQELDDAVDYYQRQRSGLGWEFADEVDRALSALAANPLMASVIEEGFRGYPLHRFPYTLVYDVIDDALFVVAVTHHSRSPGYWRGRI